MAVKSNSQHKYSVLCIDDEHEIMEIMAMQLEELGFHAYLADGPDQAIQLLEQHSHEIILIISDFKMPGMDGFELRKMLMEKWKAIPFIMCSAYISRENAISAVELKIAAFLGKPINKESFRKVVLEESKERKAQLEDDYELREGFVSEADLLLEELEPLLLSLEGGLPEKETLNRIFAIVHTIKGTSAFFRPDTISKFTHRYEDFFSPFKNGDTPFKSDTIEILLKGADTIKTLIQSFKNYSLSDVNLEQLFEIFNSSESSSFHHKNNPVIQTNPAIESKPREEVRVGVDLLNEFMELSGEITVIRNMINKLVRTIEVENGANKNISHLTELLDEMHKINGTLQDKVVEIRKIPLKNLFRPLQRTIRDLAKSLNKEIEIEFVNDSLKVDTSLAEVLSSSLIHMVRNSADHGIEMPDQRINLGKSPQGKILISGKQISDEIIIEISDDGKGLDTNFLKKKVVEKGLRSEAEIEKMSESEIQSMIFESGFSTALGVTDISGRGVGMDMVKKSIHKIGGKIEIQSKLGSGTHFFLHLPIPKSVMIIPSILIQANSEICAIPQDSVLRLLNLNEPNDGIEIKHLEGADCLLYDNSLIPLVEISKVFNQDASIREQSRIMSTQTGFIVIVRANSLVYGILVDEILDLEDTVVKKLGKHFSDQQQFLGATFLADGLVGLIIDTVGLANMLELKTDFRPKPKDIAVETMVKPQSILLFRIQGPGLLGIELSKVFRLEHIHTDQVKLSGEQETYLYRDKIMPLYCLNSLLEFKGSNILRQGNTHLPALILEIDGKFIGIVISSIEDLVLSSAFIDTNIRDRDAILGATVIDEKTVTIIDSDGLKKLIEFMNTHHETDEHEIIDIDLAA